MRVSVAVVGAVLVLAGCDKSAELLAPVNEARDAVKQHFGADWNITLPIVKGEGAAAVVCGYTEAPHEPGATPKLSDEHLFIYADHTLTLATDIGTKGIGDRAEKECPGLLRVKTVGPRNFQMGPR